MKGIIEIYDYRNLPRDGGQLDIYKSRSENGGSSRRFLPHLMTIHQHSPAIWCLSYQGFDPSPSISSTLPPCRKDDPPNKVGPFQTIVSAWRSEASEKRGGRCPVEGWGLRGKEGWGLCDSVALQEPGAGARFPVGGIWMKIRMMDDDHQKWQS